MTPSSASWPHRPDRVRRRPTSTRTAPARPSSATACAAWPRPRLPVRKREAEDTARERMAGDTQHPAAAQRKRRRKAATAKPDPGALLTDLQKARTAGEVLGAAARLCWAEAHDGAECPGGERRRGKRHVGA